MFRAIDWIAKSLRRLEPCKELLPAYCQIAGKQVLVYLVSSTERTGHPVRSTDIYYMGRLLPEWHIRIGTVVLRYLVLLPRSSKFD